MARLVKNAPKFNEDTKLWQLVFKVTQYEVTDNNGKVSKKLSFKVVDDNGKMLDLHIYHIDEATKNSYMNALKPFVNRKVKAQFEVFNKNNQYEYVQTFASGLVIDSIITTF